MNRISLTLAIALLGCSTLTAKADVFENLFNHINAQASADLGRFSSNISVQFEVPEVQVHTVLDRVKVPAEAFMVFQLVQMSRRPPEVVIEVYRKHRRRGWGAMAQELGIKPGSAEFHRLKYGEVHYRDRDDDRDDDHDRDHDHDHDDHGHGEHGHGHGHDKDHG